MTDATIAQPPHLVFIGALNVDYLADLRAVDGATLRRIEQCGAGATWGSETGVTPDMFEALTAIVADRITERRLGGSAFNAARAARAFGPPLRLGFVGSCGTDAQPAFAQWFAANAVDTRFVTFDSDPISGSCLSLHVDGERTLITTRGANDRTSLSLRSEALRAWASSAAAIHLSSLLDDQAPERLVGFLNACRAFNPRLRISIDPGAHWARLHASTSAVRDLLGMADLIFANREEMQLIRGDRNPQRANILLKRPGRLTLLDPAGAPLCDHQAPVLAPSEIRDPTGAGDIVAGAFLAECVTGEPATSAMLERILVTVANVLKGERTI